ncbi:MAG: type II toxin-antitoxin system VapC family toxin [Planctomycetes bacterium]|jgi:tRNA(fMet)-specific endonuclease VapC|nr:type II toxin-antitoxin system VapC family toxin [Planctomycetota bacterium]
MSLHVLDTDMLTLYQAGRAFVVQRVQACPPTQLAVCVISVEEELTGWYTKLRMAKKRDQLARAYQRLADAIGFLSHVRILPFPEPAIDRYETLRKSHRHVSKNDLRIAAIVLELGATPVTRNARDFHQIAGLAFEDWSK